MIVKIFSAIVTEEIIYPAEKHQLLLPNHFSRRLGWSTTESLHLLMDTIKAAWRRKQVVSVLFLDMEGAFPNAILSRFLHNLRKRRVPEVYVALAENMLTNCRTKLRFDNYMLDWFPMDNSIGQGDPLSMILYLF